MIAPDAASCLTLNENDFEAFLYPQQAYPMPKR